MKFAAAKSNLGFKWASIYFDKTFESLDCAD